jgi:hypothetical protein
MDFENLIENLIEVRLCIPTLYRTFLALNHRILKEILHCTVHTRLGIYVVLKFLSFLRLSFEPVTVNLSSILLFLHHSSYSH